MARLTEEFGKPQDSFRAIHIAGTNGKGSLAVKTATALQFCGYRTGMFTSPHIESFCERIQVDKHCIPESKVVEHADQIFQVIEQKQIDVTFFEIVTMLALLWFREQSVEYAVLECGLGGRLDATNIISQNIDCCAVTSIGRDHEEILGSALEDIAHEKAGIIKHGIKGCVLGPSACQFDVFRRQYDEAGCLPQNFVKVQPQIGNAEELKEGEVAIQSNSFNSINSEIARRVLGIALDKSQEELEALLPSKMIDEAKPPCRMEKVSPLSGTYLQEHDVQVFMDVCHNEQGMSQVLQELVQEAPEKPIKMIFGASSGKKVDKLLGVLEHFSANIESIHCVQNRDHPRLFSIESLLSFEADYRNSTASQLPAFSVVSTDPKPSNIRETVSSVLKNVGTNKTVLICGSFFYMIDAKQAVHDFFIEPASSPEAHILA